MQTITITRSQKVRITANPRSPADDPSPGTGAVWNVSDPNGIGLTADPNANPAGQSTFVFGKSIGTFQAAATGGPANAPYGGNPVTIIVLPDPPDHFFYTNDPPEPQ